MKVNRRGEVKNSGYNPFSGMVESFHMFLNKIFPVQIPSCVTEPQCYFFINADAAFSGFFHVDGFNHPLISRSERQQNQLNFCGRVVELSTPDFISVEKFDWHQILNKRENSKKNTKKRGREWAEKKTCTVNGSPKASNTQSTAREKSRWKWVTRDLNFPTQYLQPPR